MDKITSDVRHKQWLDIIHACNRLTEQIAAANQYRFGRHSEKMDDFN